MIKPYTAVGLIPTVRGIRKRADIMRNIEHLTHLVKAASWLSSLDLPVRLIAFPEGALQAFNDEVLDLDHATFARKCAIDIPGEETEELGKIAGVQRLHHGAGEGPAPRPQGPLLQRRVHHQPARPGDPEALQSLAAPSGRALGVPPRRLRLVDREVRTPPRRILAGRRHRERPPRRHDG